MKSISCLTLAVQILLPMSLLATLLRTKIARLPGAIYEVILLGCHEQNAQVVGKVSQAPVLRLKHLHRKGYAPCD